ncbi:hypothetical protein EPN87_02680 [archaeon]|nr:MAG: hypothetical protein EPN87_02680 [archaeon]
MQHYTPRKVSSITKTDKFISIIGKIASIGEDSFSIDDDTGKLEISSEHALKKGAVVRVFCSFEKTWRADIVQDMSGMDLNIYKQVEELYSRAGL